MNNIIVSMWRGEQPLWKVFWVWGLGLTLFIWLSSYLATVKGFALMWWVAVFIITLPVNVWWLVSVWRCSNNTKLIWQILARFMVVISAINTIGNTIKIFL